MASRGQTLFAAAIASEAAERLPQRLTDVPRRVFGRPARIDAFLRPDDPAAWWLLAVLPRWIDAWDVEVRVYVVDRDDPAWLPEPDARVRWGLADVQRMAPCWGLTPPAAVPPASRVAAAVRSLAVPGGVALGRAAEVVEALWSGAPWSGAGEGSPGDAAATVAAHVRARRRYGLGDGLRLGGAWYGGVDRLPRLGAALDALGRRRPGATPWGPDLSAVAAPSPADGPLRFFFSFRSPYSALAVRRVFALGRATGRPIAVRLVPPMVARGLPVPLAKRLHLYVDAARQARALGQPFRRTADPLQAWRDGAAVGLLATRQDRLEALLTAWADDVWCHGIDVTRPAGLATVAAHAGVDLADLDRVRTDPALDAMLDTNRAELAALGLWGVPCFAVGDVAWWGQDRLDALAAWLGAPDVR